MLYKRTQIIVWALYSFDLKDSLRMALHAETCGRLTLVINFVLSSACVGWFINCKSKLSLPICNSKDVVRRHDLYYWQYNSSYLFRPHIPISKGQAVPLQAWSGPEGSRKLRFPDLMTTAQDGGKVVSLTHRPPLPPGNTPGSHFC